VLAPGAVVVVDEPDVPDAPPLDPPATGFDDVVKIRSCKLTFS